MKDTLETHWRTRFEEAAGQHDEDHALAIWSRLGMEARQRVFFKVFQERIRQPKRILDVGCGPGAYARTLARAGHQAVGLDFTVSTLQKARAKALAEACPVSFTGGEIYRLPFRDEAFDGVVFIGVLQILSDERLALREITRVLRPGGVLFLMTRNRLFKPNRRADEQGRMKSFHPFALRRLLVDMGYTPARIDSVFILRGRTRLLHPILDRLHQVNPLTRPLLLGAEAFLLTAEKPQA